MIWNCCTYVINSSQNIKESGAQSFFSYTCIVEEDCTLYKSNFYINIYITFYCVVGFYYKKSVCDYEWMEN